MRLIIEPDYEKVSAWAAAYVASRINAAKPTAQKPFVLGCPTGSSPLGMYRKLIELNNDTSSCRSNSEHRISASNLCCSIFIIKYDVHISFF